MNWIFSRKKYLEPQPKEGTRRIVKSDDNLYIIQSYTSYQGWQCIGRAIPDLEEIQRIAKFLDESDREERLNKVRDWKPI